MLFRSKGNAFRIPSDNNLKEKVNPKRIKQKYGLRDTIIEIPQEAGTLYIKYHNKTKLYYEKANYYRFKIRCYAKGYLKETKYIYVGISNGCD